MNKQKNGRRVHGVATRRVEVVLPATLDDSLNGLVAVTGVSKMSLIHDALVAFLGPKGVLSPADTEPVTASTTTGTRRSK